MLKLMLDTNILIYIIKQHPIQIIDKFRQYEPSQIAISSIVYAEMMYGVYNSKNMARNLRTLHSLVDYFHILPLDEHVALFYGKIKSQLKKEGRLIGENDLLIASHACALKLPLVTNNTKEYMRVPGLILENWVA